jgi:hypothetical protein
LLAAVTSKLFPFMVTDVPTLPLSGEKDVTEGCASI